MAKDQGWTFDKHLNVGTLLALLVQTVVVGIWVGGQSARLTAVEEKLKGMHPQAERIVKMETLLDGIKESMAEIKGLLRSPQAMRLGGVPAAAPTPPAPLAQPTSAIAPPPKAWGKLPAADTPRTGKRHQPKPVRVRSGDPQAPWPSSVFRLFRPL